MAACRSQLHQSVLAVPGVQCEGLPYEDGRRHRTEADTYPLADADHVEDDEEDEESQQPTCEDEQVLSLQTFELNRTADALVDVVFSHTLLYYRKNERRMVAATMRKMHAPNQLAAVLEVSGSPDENLP